jgi:hypothetical protein
MIHLAKELPFYFCRFYPASVSFEHCFSFTFFKTISIENYLNYYVIKYKKNSKQYSSLKMIGISHSGIRFIKLNETQPKTNDCKLIELKHFK